MGGRWRLHRLQGTDHRLVLHSLVCILQQIKIQQITGQEDPMMWTGSRVGLQDGDTSRWTRVQQRRGAFPPADRIIASPPELGSEL